MDLVSGAHRRYPVGVATLLAVALAGGLLAPAGASGQSRTLGSPLAGAPNLGFGCEAKPTFTSQSFNGDYFLLPSNQPDCTWFQSGVIGSVDYSDPRTGSVPADGSITNIAVQGGLNPSAFRVVIVRQIGGLTGAGTPTTACCAFVSQTPPAGSPPFQPAPSNQPTNFPVNIPVERNIRGTSAVADYVGISGISGTGVLPLLDTGDNNTLTGYHPGSPDAGFFYPRMGALEAPGGGTRNNESIPNVEVLLQWTWTPVGGTPTPPTPPGTPTPVTPTPPAAAPTAPTANGAAQVSAGQALVNLVCNGNAACAGQLELLSRKSSIGAKATVYGTHAYSIPAGGTAGVEVKLNRKGKSLLRKRRSAKVAMRLTPTGGTPVTTVLKLKR